MAFKGRYVIKLITLPINHKIILENLIYHCSKKKKKKKTLKKQFQEKCIYLPNPSARAGYDTGSIFKQNLTDFKSEFSFS